MNSIDCLTAARAAALFVSHVSPSDAPTGAEVDEAIRHALRTHGGSRGCAADVAAAYGDYPELAARRMRWARGVVESRYAKPSAEVDGRWHLPVRIDRTSAPALVAA